MEKLKWPIIAVAALLLVVVLLADTLGVPRDVAQALRDALALLLGGCVMARRLFGS